MAPDHWSSVFVFVATLCLVRSQITPSSTTLSGAFRIATGGQWIYVSTLPGFMHQYNSTDMTEIQELSLGSTAIGLTATKSGEWLIVCLYNGVCTVRNGSDISNIVNTTAKIVGAPNDVNEATIALYAATVSDGRSFYTGSYGRIQGGAAQVRIRFTQNGFGGSNIVRESAASASNFVGRTYYGGFSVSDYAYFVVLDQQTSAGRELRIIRVCNNVTTLSALQSQYELELQCENSFLGGNTIRGVSVMNDEVLVIGQERITNTANNRLCTFNISDINSRMDSIYSTCIEPASSDVSANILWAGSDRNCDDDIKSDTTVCDFSDGVAVAVAPSDPPLMSSNILTNSTVREGLVTSIGVTIDNVYLIFVAYTATDQYYLNKYQWTEGSLSLLDEILLSSTAFAVGEVVITADTQTLVITGMNEIISVPVENCSAASSCEECVGLGDPLCGWCVFEAKCSRVSSCMDSETEGRYLSQGEHDSCLETVTIEPSQFIKELHTTPYEVTLTISPPLIGASNDEMYCVFTAGMMEYESQINIGSKSCNVEQILNRLDQLGSISLSTEFAIRSNRTGVKFYIAEDPYLFFDCTSQTICSACVEPTGTCGWCSLDFRCTGDNSTCTGGVSNWLTYNDGNSISDICPFLLPNSVSITDYTQPSNIAVDLSLNTLNTPDGVDYMCVFGNTIMVTAIRMSNTKVLCDIQQNELTSNLDTEERSLFLIQSNNGKMYEVEKNTSDINVILYDCPSLASSCSQCLGQNINTGYNCAWCSNNNGECRASSQCDDSERVTESGGCEKPHISSIDPSTGPPRGQTTINITGTNLGVVFSDITSITVGTRNCISNETEYMSGMRIICTLSTSGVNTVGTNTLTVRISTSDGIETALADFMVHEPVINSIMPLYGPVSGETVVTINGSNLDIGNAKNTRIYFRERMSGNRRRRQSCPEIECIITNITSSTITCMSAMSGAADCIMEVIVDIDEDEYSNDMMVFQYTPDPMFTSVSPQDIIPAGGITVTFSGSYLNVTQSPSLNITDSKFTSTITPCLSATNNTLVCRFPQLSPLSDISSAIGSAVQYTVLVDGATGPDSMDDMFELTLRPDPEVTEVVTNDLDLPIVPDETVIRISGSNLLNSLRQDIVVLLNTSDDSYECRLSTIADTEITCFPSDITAETVVFVTVRIGTNLMFGENSDSWRVSFSTVSAQPINYAAIGGGVGGGLFVIMVVFLLVICLVIVKARSSSKKKDMKFIKLMSDMERMEVDITLTCKAAFTDLQTDLGELVTEDALETPQLPFQPFPVYATKFFFPHAGVDHPVLCPPKLPLNMADEDFKSLMEEFRLMVLDSDFLLAFIRTLEAQTSLTLHEKSTIASLIMVACLKNMDYATEILKALLSNLIHKSLSGSRNHPKILLRRTESVAEKLLTNWFCVTLYPHLLDIVGPHMFVLFKAVKAQLEKGPIDVITGEAKNSLSEEKLLRQSLDSKVVECEVEMDNANYLLNRMREKSKDIEPLNVEQDNIQTVKLLDMDSISQIKEKLLDFFYRNRPVSQRPSITDVELELCRGSAGISLRDQDSTSKKEGEWTKINTLGHYDIPALAKAAIEDPKKSTPRFRLRYRADRPISGYNFDVPGTIIASASVTSQTSLLQAATVPHSAMEVSIASNKMYHLVKPDTGEGETKIVSEVFLTRLLSTKRILQPYVDDLFNAIFTMPRGKPFPKPIKVFFDFLDLQAAECNITDPEVLHIWKTNGLPLRFWVNLIKNPEFIFDVNKSATIDACFTVIAQAYIDACSTSEVKYTKDTPTARLLYVKEVQTYKKDVVSYYSGVQSQPSIDNDDLKLYFKENLDPFIEKFEQHHEGVHFHMDSALLELYRYATHYGDQISETLSEDHKTMVAAQFNGLRQKYNIDSSRM